MLNDDTFNCFIVVFGELALTIEVTTKFKRCVADLDKIGEIISIVVVNLLTNLILKVNILDEERVIFHTFFDIATISFGVTIKLLFIDLKIKLVDREVTTKFNKCVAGLNNETIALDITNTFLLINLIP